MVLGTLRALDGASLETGESAGVNAVTRRVNVNAGNIEDVWSCQLPEGLIWYKHERSLYVNMQRRVSAGGQWTNTVNHRIKQHGATYHFFMVGKIF